jgi:hypothetical protein
MLRRLIAVIALAAGMSIAAALTLATPALAKGPSQARITGPGLAHAIVVSGNGEPGMLGKLATLAGQTSLFTVMFGAGGSVPAPVRPRTPWPPWPRASLGPRYTVTYTVPGVTPQPGEQFGRIRQDLYPLAAGGPVIYTPPGQAGFGQQLQVTGWLRASSQLTRTLAQLGVPLRPGTHTARQTRLRPGTHPAAAQQAGSRTPAWLIASTAVIAAAAIAGTALWLRHRQPRGARDCEPQDQRVGRQADLAGARHRRHVR